MLWLWPQSGHNENKVQPKKKQESYISTCKIQNLQAKGYRNKIPFSSRIEEQV